MFAEWLSVTVPPSDWLPSMMCQLRGPSRVTGFSGVSQFFEQFCCELLHLIHVHLNVDLLFRLWWRALDHLSQHHPKVFNVGHNHAKSLWMYHLLVPAIEGACLCQSVYDNIWPNMCRQIVPLCCHHVACKSIQPEADFVFGFATRRLSRNGKSLQPGWPLSDLQGHMSLSRPTLKQWIVGG